MFAAQPQSIRRQSLVDEIAGRLQADILEGRYRPGDVLPPERELSEAYGVTRTSLKHALVRLEQLGLIETRHGVGSLVLDVEESGGADLLRHLAASAETPDVPFLTEILEARTFVVGNFVRLAAQRRTEEDMDELRDLLGGLRQNRDDPQEGLRIEGAFFRILARASHNRAFVFLTNSVTAAARIDPKTFAEPLRDRDWLERSLKTILSAVERRDEEAARMAVEEYFGESARRLLSLLPIKGGGRKALKAK